MTIISTPLEGALIAINLGFPVFPVNPHNKHPLILEWPKRATLDADQVLHWWEQAPHAMVGACTGKASGYFVVDIDTKDGVDAETKVAQLEGKFGKLDYLMAVRTPSGGMHFYCKMIEGVDLRNSAGKLGVGIDIRANGGFVVFPGSTRRDGMQYTIVKTGGSNE